MSDTAPPPNLPTRTDAFQQRLKKRYAAERRFRMLGIGAIVFSIFMLAFLLATMTWNGIGGFQRAEAKVTVDFTQYGLAIDERALRQPGGANLLQSAGLPDIIMGAATEQLGADAEELIPAQAWRTAADKIAADPEILTREEAFWLPVTDDLSAAMRSDAQGPLVARAQQLEERGLVDNRLDPGFLTRSDATDPALVGIWGALKGSLLTMVITLTLAFPIGVLAALYLEEYAPRNRWTDLIEVSINNLAAVPSIIFGLLGLAVFLTIFPSMRSAPLIGGMTLALMTMPVIVISGRNAVKSVPPSVRDGALALGASRVQTVFHHVLPLALPGILTGTIIGMARALGETAPLLMIGMRAFVATPPGDFTDPATVLPVQIFLWSDEIDRGFVERTSAAIIVLLLVLLAMNAVAIYLRNKFEKKW